MKHHLLITLADKDYVEQAKQLFSSAYWNGGWDGDYMLLSYDISEKELKWFRDKGILVKKCKIICSEKDLEDNNLVYSKYWFSTALLKLNIFSPYFKKWKNIVFLDSDAMVRASLEELKNISGFAATQNYKPKLIDEFIGKNEKNKAIHEKLSKKYELNADSFNTGVMAFSTDVINKKTYDKLLDIFKIYKSICLWGDQSVLNLYFYKKWKRLPQAYNAFLGWFNKVEQKKVRAVILHSTGGDKLWLKNNALYKEWRYNLSMAKDINITCPKIGQYLEKEKVLKYSRILNSKRDKNGYPKKIKKSLYLTFDKNIGKIGIALKKKLPGLYYPLKNILGHLIGPYTPQ